jgi:hypothetical protein
LTGVGGGVKAERPDHIPSHASADLIIEAKHVVTVRLPVKLLRDELEVASIDKCADIVVCRIAAVAVFLCYMLLSSRKVLFRG